jgi:O-6-methylguanine DNA methyltransferase|tara:strand:+ start:281497 stop:282015 length:519 start_codon:yes stop_codon:yes gene_type:complete
MSEILHSDEFTLPDIGALHICVSGNGIRSLYFITDTCSVRTIESKIHKHSPKAILIKDTAMTAPYIEKIKYTWAQKNTHLDLFKLDALGTVFQKKVWAALLNIQSGDTLQYNQIANSIGQPKAIRAAASAIAQNPISLLVPCHRVLPKSGGVGNYAGGSIIKTALLRHEKAI